MDTRLTYRDYLLLPEGKDYEILEGELRVVPAPSPRHQAVVGNVYVLLRQHVATGRLGLVLIAPIDVVLGEDSVVQPDVLFVAKERLGQVRRDAGVFGPPDLVVEVISPSRPELDREVKRKIYGKHGVREYWIVDPDAQTVEVYHGGPAGLVHRRTYTRGTEVESQVLPGLRAPVDAILAEW